ncbi:CpsD/CapB family tyrosine-protein kinase [Dyella sp.]|jgi:Mrp family chromosome partitioning ATPase|uniref:CpsD/CapB family tyrosine-protein kinase n=1 Tax=Dyella sp. TaxID=1869338 RepID=UPI002D77BAE9|nr:CpsD/CapB family tyrosine-protein kinase [Dyella sp.]HET6432969.1 CpsD/CapB family tyrosine-protein kinase [Dyella sp.]
MTSHPQEPGDADFVELNELSIDAHLPQRTSSSQSIALMTETRTLVPRQLEERRLIHPEQSARSQADVFREIRTRLLELAGLQNFITLVVAVSPRSGSSFVARNLAAAFAFDQAKTSLLIDCNLRYPEQHKVLGVDDSQGGLIDFLEQPSRGIKSVIYPTVIPHVRLIPVGTARENVGEYFSSFRMRAVIDSLRSRYDDRYIFLDGPAAKDAPDARILADLADFVVLVAGYGRDTAKSISQAAAKFDSAKLAGVIFNHAP